MTKHTCIHSVERTAILNDIENAETLSGLKDAERISEFSFLQSSLKKTLLSIYCYQSTGSKTTVELE